LSYRILRGTQGQRFDKRDRVGAHIVSSS
jgi:hypothetical protein